MSALVESSCACCGDPIRVETDGETYAVANQGAPLVFAPLVDFRRWKAPSIIDGF